MIQTQRTYAVLSPPADNEGFYLFICILWKINFLILFIDLNWGISQIFIKRGEIFILNVSGIYSISKKIK